MKIYEYYRDTANLHLNGSIAALFPAILIISGNISLFQIKGIMLLSIPFLAYSLLSFQLSLFKLKKSITINRNMSVSDCFYKSIFEANSLIVVFLNSYSFRLLLYFPDGNKAGEIRKYNRKKLFGRDNTKSYALYNSHNHVVGFFRVTVNKKITIEVYDTDNKYLGCYEKKKIKGLESRKKLLDASGKFIGAVEGATLFMDEHIYDPKRQLVGRLRRGWMPYGWGKLFPEPNTPIISFTDKVSEKEKLLRLSLLINEYFVER